MLKKFSSTPFDMPREMELLASIRTLEQRVDDLRTQVSERQARIEAMQAELAEAWRVAAVNERITQSLKASLSWKLTAPIRECRRSVIRSLQLLGGTAGQAPAPRPRMTLRERLRMLERSVRRYRKGLAASRRASLGDGSSEGPILTARAKQIHDDLCRWSVARRAA